MVKMPAFYSKLDKDKRFILLCCFFVFAVNGLYAMILGPLLPLISAEYNLNNTVSGTLLSAHQTGTLIAGFVAGILPIYLGRKKSILFLCSFVIIGFLIMVSTGNPVLLILGFLFTGLSRGSISNFNNAMVNEVSDSSPSALNFLHSIFAIGALIAPLLVILSTKIAGDSGWKISAWVIISLCLVSILLFSQMKIDSTVKKRDKDSVSYAFLKLPTFWCSCAILFFYLCAESAVNGWLVKYFVDSNIMTREYAQILASILWAVILAGRLTCVFLADKLSKNTLLLITGILMILFYLLLLSTKNTTVITIAIMGFGFSMAGIYPTTISTIGPINRKYPMAMGIFLVIGAVGAISMPTITGIFADSFGIFAGMSAIIVAMILMIAFIITYSRLKVKL